MSIRRLLLLVLAFAAARVEAYDALAAVPVIAHTVLERREHDPSLFTQGMVFYGDKLLESGGGYRESRLLLRTTAQIRPELQVRLPADWFGEGVAVLGERAVVLTWREGIAQEFTLPGLQRTRRMRYSGEGWGLTTDGTSLIQSNGSAVLIWRDPLDFGERHRVTVRAGRNAIDRLNELEWVEGWLLANVWYSDEVVVIDPENGIVRGKFALQGLLSPQQAAQAEMLNGLAWHAPTRTLWVSGKRWPWMFSLKFELPKQSRDTPP